MAKQMGLSDKDAAEYTRAVDREFRLDELNAKKDMQALAVHGILSSLFQYHLSKVYLSSLSETDIPSFKPR